MSISCTFQIALISIHFLAFISARHIQFFDLYYHNVCGEWSGVNATATDNSADRAI